MAKLWGFFDGEPFLDNPYLTVFSNPKKGGRTMAKRSRARNAKGRFVRNAKRATTKRRRVIRMRRAGVAVVNPRRRRRSPARRRSAVVRVTRRQRAVLVNPRRRRHSYRRNPAMLGGLFSTSMLKTIGLTAGGFVAVPFVEGFVAKMLPASIQGKMTTYAVRIASVIGLAMLGSKFLGRKAGEEIAIGGGVYLAMTAAHDLAPGVLPTFGLGSYLRAQPLLGSGMGAYQRSYMGGSAINASTPSRLQPGNRY
jgi:hypothetical protein